MNKKKTPKGWKEKDWKDHQKFLDGFCGKTILPKESEKLEKERKKYGFNSR
tara:strand:- start:330 stop:482 length:153 start_codon:yes stop_codon:yes gene_type:complete